MKDTTTIRIRKDQWRNLTAIKLMNDQNELADAVDLLIKEFKRGRRNKPRILGF